MTDPRHFRFRFSLTTPPAVASRGVHRVLMRPTRPRGQSDCRRQHLATNHRWQRAPRQLRRCPRSEEASSPRAHLLRLNPGAVERPAVLAPPPTGTGKDWGLMRPKRCLSAQGRVSQVSPNPAGPCSAGWPVRAHGPSGGSVRPGLQAPGPFRLLRSLVWAGAALQQPFLSQGWDEPARGKGLSGPQPPAPPRSPVELSIFKHTYTYTNLHGGFVTRVHPGSATRHSQVGTAKKKKKSIKWPLHCHGALVVFLFALSLLRLQGCPCPWGPRDSGLWFGKLADEVFVCLFVTERREVGGRSSGKRSSITCSG